MYILITVIADKVLLFTTYIIVAANYTHEDLKSLSHISHINTTVPIKKTKFTARPVHLEKLPPLMTDDI